MEPSDQRSKRRFRGTKKARMRPEQNGLQGVGWAAAPDGVSQPPTLTHPAIDPPAFPQAGVFFHRAVCVDATPESGSLRHARYRPRMAVTVSVTAIPNLPRAAELCDEKERDSLACSSSLRVAVPVERAKSRSSVRIQSQQAHAIALKTLLLRLRAKHKELAEGGIRGRLDGRRQAGRGAA